MKATSAFLTAAMLAASAVAVPAQTINWASQFFSGFADSDGIQLDETSYTFELGTFADIEPDENNTSLWYNKWRVFDRAAYTEATGYFTSTVEMRDDGTSNSAALTPGAPSFEGMKAYLWVRNDNNPQPGSQWLLVRDTAWVFPTAIPGCCNNGLPIAWSVSDLDAGDVPEWGSQGGVTGPGEFTVTGSFTLQTHTFPLSGQIPEPSAAVLLSLSGLAFLRRRRSR
jgi:hypothetical protein